jgi:superfamily II DNA/RNA helicase
MHSDLSQSERDEIMFQYKSRKIDMIVATDILARGIDIDDIRIVINYDVPRDCDDYIHRIGRTARAGSKGRAITFVWDEDQEFFGRIEEFIEQNVTKMDVPSELGEAPAYEPKKKKQKNSVHKGKGRGGRAPSNNKGGNEKKNNGNGKKRDTNHRKPASMPQESKESKEQPQGKESTPQSENKEKKRRNNRRRYRKPHKKEGGTAQEN